LAFDDLGNDDLNATAHYNEGAVVSPRRAGQTQNIRRSQVMEWKRAARGAVNKKRVPIVGLVGEQNLERILRLGLIGRIGLPQTPLKERRSAARLEVEHIRDAMLNQPIGVQIGAVKGLPPKWQRAKKGSEGAALLQRMLDRTSNQTGDIEISPAVA
jgi:hypothetical protein